MTDRQPPKRTPAKRRTQAKPKTRAKATAKKAAKRVGKADLKATHASMRFRDSAPMKVFAAFCEAADQPPLIVASAGTFVIGLLARRGDVARGGARMLASHLLATGMKMAVKQQFDRTRPNEAVRHGHKFERGDEGDHGAKSFPSGHTAGAVAVARAAAHEIDGAAVPAALASVAVAAGQAPAGNHYLTDVVAGAAIGWAAEAAVGYVFDRIEERAQTHPLPRDGRGENVTPATATPRPT